ncbi:MAG: YeeE/YedE thiosulfate transporter family protein [Opitutus sp.]
MNSPSMVVFALIGGGLIGLGSLLAVLVTGKMPGISGVLSGILRRRPGDTMWRVVFLLGLVGGTFIALRTSSSAAGFRPHGSMVLIAVAGVLVGFGTRIGRGCTSGHGVCGLGMGSKSAFVATLLFIAAGIATVWVVNHTGWVSLS